MASATSVMLERVNVLRNSAMQTQRWNIIKKGLAQAAYIVIVPFAIVEAAISWFVEKMGKCLCANTEKYTVIQTWKTSSANSLLWAVHSTWTNAGPTPAFQTEKQFTKGRSNSRPIMSISQPPEVDPDVADILKDYTVGPNAKRYSPILQKLYHELPEPTDEELTSIGPKIFSLLDESIELEKRTGILEQINALALVNQSRPARLNEWERRYIKMLVGVCKHAVYLADTLKDPSYLSVLKDAVVEGYENCSNRKTTEIERLYFSWVVPLSNADYIQSQTETEILMYELSQYRIHVRDKIISAFCDDSHGAASNTWFTRELNQSTFYLPPPPLSQIDTNHSIYAMKYQKELIIEAFQKSYESPNTIYTAFTHLLYPRKGEEHLYKPATFSEWLNNNKPLEDNNPSWPFKNDDMTEYQPSLIVRYLEALGFLQRKNAP